MEERKKEELAQLYALRAGLSAVAVKQDEVKRLKETTSAELKGQSERYGHAQQHCATLRADLQKATRQVQEAEKAYEKAVWDTEHIELHWQNERKSKEQAYRTALSCYQTDLARTKQENASRKRENIGDTFKYIFAIIGFILLLGGILIGEFFLNRYFIQDVQSSGGFFAWVFCIIFIILAVGAGIALIVCLFKFVAPEVHDLKPTFWSRSETPQAPQPIDEQEFDENHFAIFKQKYANACEQAEKQLNDAIQKQQKLQADLNGEEQASTALQQNLERSKKENRQSLARQYQIGSSVYQSLQNQFSDLLDERDWNNLDLVIYAYETGRADSIKESLLYLDNRLHHERVESMIAEATHAITQTIQANMRDLAVNMTKCFKVLSDEMVNISEGIANASKIMVANAEMQYHMHKSTENLISSAAAKIDYMSALQKMQNVSSQKLAEENQVFLSQARAYMDQAAVQMRNNGGRI